MLGLDGQQGTYSRVFILSSLSIILVLITCLHVRGSQQPYRMTGNVYAKVVPVGRFWLIATTVERCKINFDHRL
jgi:hypothetical protein